MKKLKQFAIDKTQRRFGTTIDKVPWAGDGHFIACAKYVKMDRDEEALSIGNKDWLRSIGNIAKESKCPDFQNILDDTKNQVEIFISNVIVDAAYLVRILFNQEQDLMVAIQEQYFQVIKELTFKCAGPLNPVHCFRGDDLVAIVMGMRMGTDKNSYEDLKTFGKILK